MKTEQIAVVCHEANRAYCAQIGDDTQKPWDESPEWQKKSAVAGVEFCQANPIAPASANHDCWLDLKKKDGWKYGPVKDAEKKEHPCCVPYNKLPIDQQKKDSLFKAIVAALSVLALVLSLTLSALAAPDSSLTSEGWYCIWVPANNSPVMDWDTYYSVNAWVEWCYGGSYSIWREGDSDGWYWYLRIYDTTAR